MSDDLIILIESDETVIAEIAEQGPTGPEGPTGPPGEVGEHTHDAEDVTQDETHRFVTDAEKAAWTAKQDALGYTPVNTTDLRLSDARAPTAHAASHATGGTDAITPAGIGASETGHDHDETYAPLAKGVTNGDTHDHSGGDGSQIAFSSLGATPTTLVGYGITDAAAAADLSGKADLVNGLVPASQLPSYVDDVLEYANLAAFPAEGETGKIYVALDNNLTYRWTGTVYGVLNPSLALGETMDTAYRGDRGKTAYDHSQSAHDYAPSSHVGTGGTAHAVATDSVAGFMSAAAMAKLNGNSLSALSNLTPAANKIPYFTGAAAATLTDITATGVSLLGVADAAAGRTALGLGSIATQAADSVSLTGGSISGMTSISGSTLTSTVATGTAPLTITSTTLVTNLNTDAVDGFHASQTPGANQIPVFNSSGRLVLDGTDDGSSKIQTGGVIKAGSLILMGGELIGSSSLKVHPETSDGADSGVSYVCGGGWPQPSRGGFLEVRGNESASYPGDVRIISGGDSTFGNVSLLTGGGYERFRITPSGRILAGPTSPTDNGVDALQVNGSISLVGNLNIKNAGGSALVVNNYSGANSTGSNVWIGGGGVSSIGESGATYKGSCNVAAGASALNSATTAYWNAAIGYTALYGITTGYSNTALGYAAGRFISGGSVLNTISTGSLYLGAATKAGTDGNTNELVIGFDTTGMGSNTVILGNSSITHTYLRGQVLIGTTTPQAGVAATINGIIALQSSSSLVGMITTGSTINTFRSSTILGLYSGGLDTEDEHLRLTSAGRILAGPTLPIDNNIDALQVGGDMTVSGGYKVDGTQVVSNRVVDARIDDTINDSTWDSTTAGVLDAIRDAMVSHGLMAAS